MKVWTPRPPTSDCPRRPGSSRSPDPRAHRTAARRARRPRIAHAGRAPAVPLRQARGPVPVAAPGIAAEAALQAIRDGLLETVRTETQGQDRHRVGAGDAEGRGRSSTSTIRRKSVLRELKDVLEATRAGVPAWMAEAKAELAALSAQLRGAGAAMLAAARRPRERGSRRRCGGPRRPARRSPSRSAGWCRGRSMRSSTSTSRPTPARPAIARCRNCSTRCGCEFPDLTLPAFHDGAEAAARRPGACGSPRRDGDGRAGVRGGGGREADVRGVRGR